MATPLLADPADLAPKLDVASDDPELLSAIRRASNRFRGDVRWQVHHVTGDTAVLDGHGRAAVSLRTAHVTDVELVEERRGPEWVELVEGRDYDWSHDGILERRGRRWPSRRRSVRAMFDHGYPEDDLPAGIAEAVLDAAEVVFNVERGLSSLQVGGISQSFGALEAMGTSERWASAVAAHRIRSGDRA